MSNPTEHEPTVTLLREDVEVLLSDYGDGGFVDMDVRQRVLGALGWDRT